MIAYKELNLNPKGKKTTDCVVRALTYATKKPYEQVMRELCELSLKTGYFMNEKRLEEKFLEANGFYKVKQPKKSDGTKYLLKELDKIVPYGIVVASCAHHLTVIDDSIMYDIWDCRNKTVGNYYLKKGR